MMMRIDKVNSHMITIAVLRNAPCSEVYIGFSDIEVWRLLAEKGYEVYLLLQGGDNEITYTTNMFNKFRAYGLGITGFPIVSHLIYCLLSLFKIIRIKPHVVVVTFLTFPVGYVYKLLRKNVILILDIRSIPVGEQWRTWLHSWLLKVSLRSRSLDGLTIITKEMLAWISRFYGIRKDIKWAVWGSGVSPEFFNENIDSSNLRERYQCKGCFVILYHGSITKERRLENLIYAMKILVDKGIINLRLWMLGDGNSRAELQSLVSKLDLDKFIRFIGPVPYYQVGKYIAASDACICPLPKEPKWFYQFPLKIIECLAVGKPVITIDIPAHRHFDGILLYSNDDPLSIADAIEKFVSLPKDFKKELKEKALNVARNYTWEKHGEKIDAFLRLLLKF